MSVMTQHLIRILQCDKRPLPLTEKKVQKIEDVVFELVEVDKEYDDIREKTIYTLHSVDGDLVFESKHRIDALAKLILRTPSLYEPVKNKYNEMVTDRYRPPRDRREEKKEARYQRRLELIRKLNGM